MIKAVFSKWKEEDFAESLDVEEAISKFADKIFKHSDPTTALEDIVRYGFSTKSVDIMGLNEILRQIRRKKMEQLRKNLRSAYQNFRSEIRQVAEKELEGISEHFSEKYRRGDVEAEKDEMARREMMTDLPPSVSSSMERLCEYDQNFGFLSDEAKKKFSELLEKLQMAKALEEFLRKHPYGFIEGKPMSLEEALEVVKDFRKLESLEEQLRMGTFEQADSDTLKEMLGTKEHMSLKTLSKMVELLREGGYVKVQGIRLVLTPKGIRKIGEKVLKDIYGEVRKGFIGTHKTRVIGDEAITYEETKEWKFGDRTTFDVVSTIKNAILAGRYESERRKIKLQPEDFVVYKAERTLRCSTALLLDMSWSMSWGGKFESAKKVALALYHLISTHFPNDSLYIVGFFTVATELKPSELPTAELNIGDPFTNMQDALRLSRELLMKDANTEKQIILITDGQPTAYFRDGRLHVEWPVMGMSPNAMEETMKEVEKITKNKITLNVFMIEDNPYVEKFVEDIVRVNRGRTFFTTPETLSRYVLMDFILRKRKLIT